MPPTCCRTRRTPAPTCRHPPPPPPPAPPPLSLPGPGQYISLLREAKLRARLRAAHEALAERFPLAPALWLAWVSDQLGCVDGPEDVEYVLGLLRRATQDYLDVDVWAMYLQ